MSNLYTDAIMGLSLDWDIVKYLPTRLWKLTSEYKYRAVRDVVDLYSDADKQALYAIMNGYALSKKEYENFEVRCDEEIAFDESLKRFVAKMRKKKEDEGKLYINVDEIADTINFNILYKMALKEPKAMGILYKNGTFDRRCTISEDDMKIKSEGIKEQKLRDVMDKIKKSMGYAE